MLEDSSTQDGQQGNRKFKLLYNPNLILANCSRVVIALGLSSKNTQTLLNIFPNATDLHIKIKPSLASIAEDGSSTDTININHFKVSSLHIEADRGSSGLPILSQIESLKVVPTDLDELVIARYCVNLRRIRVSGFSCIRSIKVKAPQLQRLEFVGLHKVSQVVIGKSSSNLRTLSVTRGLFIDQREPMFLIKRAQHNLQRVSIDFLKDEEWQQAEWSRNDPRRNQAIDVIREISANLLD